MSGYRRLGRIAPALGVGVALAGLPLIDVAGAAGPQAKPKPVNRSVLRSRNLWATVDICNPPDQPNTVGIRGSMPGDGGAHETMYMRIRMQYRSPTGWQYVATNADSGWIAVGSARYRVRQAGDSFTFTPVAGQPAYRLRGVVQFRWSTTKKIVHQTTTVTAAGHPTGADGDPKNYSSATCVIE